MQKFTFTLLFSLIFSTGFCQTKTVLDTSDYKERNFFIENFKKSSAIFIKDVKEKNSGKVAKILSVNYKDFETDFVKEIKDKNFTFKSGLEDYIQDIISDLRKNNTSIPAKIDVLIEKSNYPNAYCLANNTFVVNMGLFNWVENRDQMMAIISHELGHNLLHHVLNGQIASITENLNESKVVKSLKEQKNNRTAKAFDLLKSKVYAQKALKRNHEIEADSIGYVLFNNTSKNKFEYVNALKNLLEFDTISPVKISKEIYVKLFDLPSQKFNEKWFQAEDFTGYNYDGFKQKLDKDSIATHPETIERIAKLKTSFAELMEDKKPLLADELYQKKQDLSKIEILPNYFSAEKYGLGIYAAMQFLQESKNENTKNHAFYKEWLGKCFTQIYEGRKSYKLNRYLDSVDPKNQDESYQLFLNFMWNLKLEELKVIADFYNGTV